MRTRVTPALIAAVVATLAVLTTASAGNEPSTPAADLGGLPPCSDQQTRPLCPRITAISAEPRTIVWQRIDAAASYRLEVDGNAIRVNAVAPYCTAPLIDAVHVIALDVTVPGDVSELPLELPRLPPPDTWEIKDIRVTITALDANNNVLETDGFALIAEAGCDDASGPRPPSRAPTQLPGAGAPSDDYDHAAKAPIGVAIAVIGVAIIGYALWKQSRASHR